MKNEDSFTSHLVCRSCPVHYILIDSFELLTQVSGDLKKIGPALLNDRSTPHFLSQFNLSISKLFSSLEQRSLLFNVVGIGRWQKVMEVNFFLVGFFGNL